MRIRKATSVIAIALMVTVPIMVGCESIERETGLTKGTQTGAVVGATGGGLIAAAAGASPAWIAAAVILGAVAGGVVGNQLTKKDKEQYSSSSYDAVSKMGKGGKTSWRNPESGNSGSTTINEVFTKGDGTKCKRFTQKITADGKTHTQNGIACQEKDGTWKITNI
jgi:surface antigen